MKKRDSKSKTRPIWPGQRRPSGWLAKGRQSPRQPEA